MYDARNDTHVDTLVSECQVFLVFVPQIKHFVHNEASAGTGGLNHPGLGIWV